jgi:glycosyltransferase involved in cell wall biosynthesis
MNHTPMRVAFNATSLLSPLTGIGQYSKHIAKGLVNRTDAKADFFYGAVWSSKLRDTPPAFVASSLPRLRQHIPGSYALRRWVQNRCFTSYVKARNFDLYHEPNILPLPFDGPTVLTVHDLSWIHYPHAHPKERVRLMGKYFEPGLRTASLILTDSAFVKHEIVDMFCVDADRVLPVPLGVEPLFHPRSNTVTKPVLQRLGLSHGEYILAVGTLEPRKNLQVALRAFLKLPKQVRQRYPLVLAGMKGWHTNELDQQIEPLAKTGEVRQLGYLQRENLASLIAGSTCLIYPSIYEGFGLPPLEAMACGVPVLSANASSIPEVVGDTGILLDPQDVDGFKVAIEMLISAPDVREALGRKALARSAMFSWDACVSQTLEAYRLALSKS